MTKTIPQVDMCRAATAFQEALRFSDMSMAINIAHDDSFASREYEFKMFPSSHLYSHKRFKIPSIPNPAAHAGTSVSDWSVHIDTGKPGIWEILLPLRGFLWDLSKSLPFCLRQIRCEDAAAGWAKKQSASRDNSSRP